MRNFRRRVRRSFRKRRAVSWLTPVKSGPNGTEITAGVTDVAQFIPLENTENTFIATNQRFAAQNDIITYLRILGQLRLAYYPNANSDITLSELPDVVCDYGICLVKGEYADDGTWAVDNSDVPKLTESSDDPEKWLFRNHIIFNPGFNPSLYDPVSLETTHLGIGYVPALLSTDQLGPGYSWVDIKPKRRAQYSEKLGIIVELFVSSEAAPGAVYLNHNLRVLTAKYG